MIMIVIKIKRRSRFNGRVFYNMIFILDPTYHDLSSRSISESFWNDSRLTITIKNDNKLKVYYAGVAQR